MPEGEILFEMESIGYEFFIILQGIVSICIKIPISDNDVKAVTQAEDAPLKEKLKPRSKSSFEGVPKSPLNVNSTVLHKKSGYHVMHRTVLLKGIKDLSDGGSFGEAALIKGKSAMRNATILCKSDCYFAVLDKENYERIIGEHQQRQLNEKINFLKRVMILRCMNTQDLSTLNYFFELKILKYREVIFRQGDKLDCIYVIKSGTVRVGCSHLSQALQKRKETAYLAQSHQRLSRRECRQAFNRPQSSP